MRRHPLAGFVLLLFATAAHAAPTEDQRRAEAKTLFEDGVKAATAGDSKAALVAFRAAYEKFPSPKVLYNIGQSCKSVGDNACAVHAYEKYLKESENLDKKRVQQVEGELKALVKSVGRLTIKSNIPAADVLVDDAVAGRTPTVADYPVNPGSHKVSVPYHGKSVDKTVKVAAGESANAQVDAPDEPAPLAIPVIAKEPEPKNEPLAPNQEPTTPAPAKGFPVVPWTITGVLAAGTAVTGILAASALSDYQAKKDEYPISRDDLDSAQGSARDLFLITGLLGAGTLIAGSIALYQTFTSPAATTPNPRVGVAAGPGGVTIRGVFP